MKWFARLLGLVRLNAVPVVGVSWAGWTTAAAADQPMPLKQSCLGNTIDNRA
jgi:hypothetical protein